jgi:hypothetical protein
MMDYPERELARDHLTPSGLNASAELVASADPVEGFLYKLSFAGTGSCWPEPATIDRATQSGNRLELLIVRIAAVGYHQHGIVDQPAMTIQ